MWLVRNRTKVLRLLGVDTPDLFSLGDVGMMCLGILWHCLDAIGVDRVLDGRLWKMWCKQYS